VSFQRHVSFTDRILMLAGVACHGVATRQSFNAQRTTVAMLIAMLQRPYGRRPRANWGM